MQYLRVTPLEVTANNPPTSLLPPPSTLHPCDRPASLHRSLLPLPQPRPPPRAVRPLQQPESGAHHEQDPEQVEAGYLLHVAINLSCGEGLESVNE